MDRAPQPMGLRRGPTDRVLGPSRLAVKKNSRAVAGMSRQSLSSKHIMVRVGQVAICFTAPTTHSRSRPGRQRNTSGLRPASCYRRIQARGRTIENFRFGKTRSRPTHPYITLSGQQQVRFPFLRTRVQCTHAFRYQPGWLYQHPIPASTSRSTRSHEQLPTHWRPSSRWHPPFGSQDPAKSPVDGPWR